MKILLAAPRGFCAGVNMAVKSLDLALKHLAPRSTFSTKSFTTSMLSDRSSPRVRFL